MQIEGFYLCTERSCLKIHVIHEEDVGVGSESKRSDVSIQAKLDSLKCLRMYRLEFSQRHDARMFAF